MGQSQSLKNLDKRTARREYQEDFSTAIQSFRHQVDSSRDHPRLSLRLSDDSSNEWDGGSGGGSGGDHGIQVNVRKRPLFDAESNNSEFDVISCVTPRTVIVHDARLDSDMKTQLLRHHEFTFNRVFDDTASNDDVYNETVGPLVRVVRAGGDGTVFMYGQTGSGKTYTMTSIYRRLAAALFTSKKEHGSGVRVSFFEISGENCYDLLNHCNNLTVLKCNRSIRPSASQGDTEYFEAYPVVEPVVHSAQDFLDLIKYGIQARSTAATGVHDASSRSHAVLKVFFNASRSPTNRGRENDMMSNIGAAGILTLIDLAGSEHRVDSMYHSKARQQESNEINASLMALKTCLRARGKKTCDSASLYRKSKLTMMLKNSLVSRAAHTSVIVTVSPASKDTEHSLNSLRHACLMDGQDTTQGGKETRFMTGGLTTTVRIGEVKLTAQARQRKILAKQGIQIDLKTCNGNTRSHGQSSTFGDGHDTSTAVEDNRRPSKISMQNLGTTLKAELTRCRRELGFDKNQLSRLGAVPVQVLKKALEKAGISHDRSQRILNDNIDSINSSRHQRSNLDFNYKTRKIKKSTESNVSKMMSEVPRIPSESIASIISDLHPAVENCGPHNELNSSCATTMRLHENISSSTFSETRNDSKAFVTHEDVKPVVFKRLPSSDARCQVVHQVMSDNDVDFGGPDLCAESICSSTRSPPTSTGGSFRVNKSAALRQKHSAEKAKKLEKEKCRKKQLHNNAWSSAGVSRTVEDDESSTSNWKTTGDVARFTPGRPWAVDTQSEPVHSRGGMFFEVVDGSGNSDVRQSKKDNSRIRNVVKSNYDKSDDPAYWSPPVRTVNDEPLRRPSQGSDMGTRNVWSVDLARSRYGSGWEYD